MVYTVVLEATAERIESSSLSLRTISCVVMENLVYPIRALSLTSLSAGTRNELDYDEIGLIIPYSKHRTLKANG